MDNKKNEELKSGEAGNPIGFKMIFDGDKEEEQIDLGLEDEDLVDCLDGLSVAEDEIENIKS